MNIIQMKYSKWVNLLVERVKINILSTTDDAFYHYTLLTASHTFWLTLVCSVFQQLKSFTLNTVIIACSLSELRLVASDLI